LRGAEIAPLGESGDAVELEDLPTGEAAFLIELVEDRGMNGCELLYAGTQSRACYTCIGMTVNLAARLESHTKVVGREILIDAETSAGLTDAVAPTLVGTVAFKGLSAPLDVFSVS
jgi:class 3 adenylate cyclase